MERLPREVISGDDPLEVAWLRIKSLTNARLVERMLVQRGTPLSCTTEVLSVKAAGVASSIASGVGYWTFTSGARNSKVLSRYYALLQFTLAEEVARTDTAETLSDVQKHTEQGHGLALYCPPDTDTFEARRAHALWQGHFAKYAQSQGLDPRDFAFQARLKGPNAVPQGGESKVESITSLFAKVPELAKLIKDHLGEHPRVVSLRNPQVAGTDLLPSTAGGKTTSWITVEVPQASPEESVAVISSMQRSPFLNPRVRKIGEVESVVCQVEHIEGKYWHDALDTYSSSFSERCWIEPLFGRIADPLMVHFVLLYSLSIIVRYLPELWRKIDTAELSHVGSLIDYYLHVVDRILPPLVLGRIIHREIDLDHHGSLSVR